MQETINATSEWICLYERVDKLSSEIQKFIDESNNKSCEQFLEEFPSIVIKLEQQYQNIERMKILAAVTS